MSDKTLLTLNLTPGQMEMLERVRQRIEVNVEAGEATLTHTILGAVYMAHERLYGGEEHNRFVDQAPHQFPEEAERAMQKALLKDAPTGGQLQ